MSNSIKKISYTWDWKIIYEINEKDVRDAASHGVLAKLYARCKLLSRQTHNGRIYTYIFNNWLTESEKENITELLSL